MKIVQLKLKTFEPDLGSVPLCERERERVNKGERIIQNISALWDFIFEPDPCL